MKMAFMIETLWKLAMGLREKRSLESILFSLSFYALKSLINRFNFTTAKVQKLI
jgi:hypothetical protein